nr:hypothetical protein Iba_scaffold33363CG0060 [Ipomoea batatas]GMC74351.1 hypothetical protein Iba_scaffold34145CG0010 [Ipomoea batatas]
MIAGLYPVFQLVFQEQHWLHHFFVMVGVWSRFTRNIRKLLMHCVMSNLGENNLKLSWSGYFMKLRRKLESYWMNERSMKGWWRDTLH